MMSVRKRIAKLVARQEMLDCACGPVCPLHLSDLPTAVDVLDTTGQRALCIHTALETRQQGCCEHCR